MQRRYLSALGAILLLAPLMSACATKSDPDAANDIRIYQILPVARKSAMVEAPGEGEAIVLINAGTKPHTLTGWTVQSGSGQVTLPKLTVEPGKTVYLANDAEYFTKYWNFSPTFEFGADTDPGVPDLKVPDNKVPILQDSGDVVKLLDDEGKVVDLVAYGNAGDAPAPWSGPAVQLVSSFPLQPGNQVLTRLKTAGKIRLESSAAAWSGGTKLAPERVYFAGQSDFPVKSVTGNMTLTAASAPDNAGKVLFDLIGGAKKTIRMVGYQFNNKELATHLIAAAKKGVKVTVAIERNPSGGDMYDSDKEAQQMLHEGGVEVIYYHKWDGDLSTRFNPVHSKYVIVDDEAVLIATGNYTTSVYSADTSCGNREWMAVIKSNPDVVKLFREVWDFDFASGHPEVRVYDEALDAPRQPDTYDAGPCIEYKPVKPQPLTVSGQATVTRILSPDNTMDREQGFLGLLRNAKQELAISAAYINHWWGAAGEPANLESYPDPYLVEIVAAARRGVDVKVLLDYRHVKAGDLRGNQYVEQYLNDLAKKENLKLEARLVNHDASGIGRTYHNKSLIVDGAVVISSINGSENSFRYARETAIKVEGVTAFTDYYRDLFMHDWQASAKPNRPADLKVYPRTEGSYLDWLPNQELDVAVYEVYYKKEASAEWEKLGETEKPGFTDTHDKGIWGVVAVSKDGARSNYAEFAR